MLASKDIFTSVQSLSPKRKASQMVRLQTIVGEIFCSEGFE